MESVCVLGGEECSAEITEKQFKGRNLELSQPSDDPLFKPRLEGTPLRMLW